FVQHRDACHHRQPVVADLAERVLVVVDIAVEPRRERGKTTFLAIFAGHTEAPPIDLDIDLAHARILLEDQGSSTALTVLIASSSFFDTSSLVPSSLSARATARSSSPASRLR